MGIFNRTYCRGTRMLLIHDLKLKPGFSEDELKKKVSAALKVMADDINSITLYRVSIDARKKPDIFMNVSVLANVNHEVSVVKRCHNESISIYDVKEYAFSELGKTKLNNPPVVVGSGPCGLFAALMLAEHGYKPIVLERGFDVDSRINAVNNFWENGDLNRNCNVLFGEGGAGTFSDGKLNTLVKDKSGRNRKVLELFVKYGADESILYDAKPHIGTDVLVDIVKRIRNDIIKLGGQFRYNAQLTNFKIKDGKITHVVINGIETIETDVCVLAIGHSARDTFRMLFDNGVFLSQKDFAVGFRVEHLQSKLNHEMYGNDESMLNSLPPATYKLTYKSSDNRGVYSFCMCPGGYVVNASSEENALCVNGMSYSKRDGINCNSAIVVTVTTDDYKSSHPLAGIEFQRELEKKAFSLCNGKIPVSFYRDFKDDVEKGKSEVFDDSLRLLYDRKPQTKGAYEFTSLKDVLPDELNKAFIEGMEHFGKIIRGFNDDYAILSAVESRTSSPVRIERDDDFMSVTLKGIYPGGEGAGYAGGITSAAMDGMKIAEAVASKYCPLG